MKRDDPDLKSENGELRGKIRELEDALEAIHSGEVDAIIVSKGDTRQVYTIEGVDRPYRALVENIREGALTLSRSGMILYTNTRFAEMVHLSPEKVFGTSLTDYISTEHRTEFEDALCSIMKKAARIQVTLRQGKISLPVLISMNPLSGDNDTKISVILTDRRDDEERSRLQARMLDSVGDAIIVADTDQRIIYWNDAATKIYGWKPEDILGYNIAEVTFPEIPKKNAGEIAARDPGVETRHGMFEARHRDGHLFPVHVNDSPLFDDDQNLIAIISVSHDITKQVRAESALRESEERYRTLFETMTDGFSLLELVIDETGKPADLRYLSVNPAFERQTGLKADAVLGQKTRDLFPGADPSLFRRCSEVVLTGKPAHFEESFGPLSRWYDISAYKTGEMQIAVIFSDITDRRNAEENIVASLQEKEVLLREIHHRVKNNLQLMSGLLDMTRMQATDEATNGILTDMMLKIQTMAQVHNKLYEGNHLGKINLNGQIRDQITELSDIFSHNGPRIHFKINPGEVFLPADQALPCALAVNEILSNAYKHAFNGRKQGTIEISAVLVNGQIRITISDDGIGLPDHFDIRDTNRLGIKLVSTLVQNQLKGMLTFESRNGTTICIEFPVVQ
jgi:PAS domain S-box-containing protein